MRLEKAQSLNEKLSKNRTIQNYIAQGSSRYILFNVGEAQGNFPAFTNELNNRLMSIAFSYLSIGCTLAEGGQYDEATTPLERAATILEHIHLPEANSTPSSPYYLLVSGLAYYAASQYSKSFIILKRIEFDADVSRLVAAFLRKDFQQLLIDLNRVLIEKTYLQEIENDEDSANYGLYIYLIAKSLSQLLEYLYSGNRSWYEGTQETLNDLMNVTEADNDPSIWWISRLLKILVDGFEESALWNSVLPPLSDSDYKLRTEEYIRGLAFGKPSIVELFVSQRASLDQVLAEDGAVVSLPTSSGKTRIAEISILQNLINNPDSVVLYLAPFRSLAFEIEESLSKVFRHLGVEVSHLYGGSQFNKVDQTLIDNSNILIATPEKAKAIIRADTGIAERIKLVIVDEGHLLGDNKRHIVNELFIEELKLHVRRNEGKLILLSAVLPNTSEISQWVTKSNDKIAQSDWRPSSQRFGLLAWTGRNVDISWISDEEPKAFNRSFLDRSTGWFPDNKRDAVAASAVKLVALGSVLIFVGRQNMVMSQARSVLAALGGDHAQPLDWKNPEDWELFELSCMEAFGSNSEVLKFAKYGIICHSAGLPADVRISMERLMRNGNPSIIISTSTLAQGVNIGVSSVIIANVYISASPIDSKDFWNIAGRAGRAFIDSEGKILYAIDGTKVRWKINKDIKLARKYFDASKMENAFSGVLSLVKRVFKIADACSIDKGLLLELIAENDFAQFNTPDENYEDSIKSLFDWMDDTLLAINIEFESYDLEDPSDWIDDYLRESLAYIQAEKDEEIGQDEVISFFKARNAGVINLAGDSDRWRSIVASGIPLRSGLIIEEYLDEILEIHEVYKATDQTPEDLSAFLFKAEQIAVRFPSEDFKVEHDLTDLNPVRLAWLSGRSLDEIIDLESGAQKICTQYFGFSLPWAINAIARKLSDFELTEEAEAYSDLAMLAEMGLPNFKASQIYLAGIRSRVAATELSGKLQFERSVSLRAIRNYIVKNEDALSPKCSELTQRWLKSFTKSDSKSQVTKISPMLTVDINLPEKTNDELLLRQTSSGNLFFCSADYEYIQPITTNDEDLVIAANNPGITFEHDEETNMWYSNFRDPHIQEKP
jgi:hypothetical protein